MGGMPGSPQRPTVRSRSGILTNAATVKRPLQNAATDTRLQGSTPQLGGGNSEFAGMMDSYGGSNAAVAQPGWAEASLAQGSLPGNIDRTTTPGSTGQLTGMMAPPLPLTSSARGVQNAAGGSDAYLRNILAVCGSREGLLRSGDGW